MKRTPLGRNVPLGRGQGKGLSRESRLAPRSKRTQAAYAGPDGRRALVARLLAERPVCEYRWKCDGARSVDVDEVKARSRGGSILDEANCRAVCRACHEAKHAEPAEAERRGFSRSSWEE